MLVRLVFFALLSLLSLTSVVADPTKPKPKPKPGPFSLKSSTFNNNDPQLPLSLVFDNPICALTPDVGLNESPELSWTGAPGKTAAFVVILYDTTASFTHWGLYNIDSTTNNLPAGAGAAGITIYGDTIVNDFGNPVYEGPCPPGNVAPDAHYYVFTVYALSKQLPTLGTPPNFPATAESLLQALYVAAVHGEVLGQASIAGFYSSIAPNNATTV